MKAILLLAAVYSLIINQSQKKSPVNNNGFHQQIRSIKKQDVEKTPVTGPLQAMETLKDHGGGASLLYEKTLFLLNGSVKRAE